MAILKAALRCNLTRIAFVEAIMAAQSCTNSSECSCGFCTDLELFHRTCGLRNKNDQSKHLEHLLPTLIGTREEDALDVLSIQHANNLFKNGDLFSGFMEIPKGALPAYRYYEENKGLSTGSASALNRQTCYILATIALPDAYLEYFRTQFN